MMTIQEAFKAQLEGSTPSDGTYNGLTTVEQVAEYLSNTSLADGFDVEAYATKALKEFAEHKGERKVYYLEFSENGIQVLTVWEKEFGELSVTHEVMDPPFDDVPGQTIPRFVKRTENA